jgi:plastocyanin
MMDPLAIWVTVGGAVLAIAVNVYFFSPRRAAVASAPAPLPASRPEAGADASADAPTTEHTAPLRGKSASAVAELETPPVTPAVPQEVRITVRDGYDPAVIEVGVGRPVRLIFRREEVEGCSDTVLLPEWGIVQRLPAYQDSVVEFTPPEPGQFEFTCGMHMLRGKVVVR